MAHDAAWWRITLQGDESEAQRLTAALQDAGASAVTLQDAADQPLYEPSPGQTPLWEQTLVTGLFPPEPGPETILPWLAETDGQLPPYQVERLADQDWQRVWLDHFQPMRFGQNLWVCPRWQAPPDPEAAVVRLDPGLAFGTGTHPTTSLCLQWLDTHPPVGLEMLDYGAGSGILAIAAAKLGARRVWAVDHDAQAVQASQDNADDNGVADTINALPAAGYAGIRVDLIMANILATPLTELAPQFARWLNPGGQLVLSGILSEQAEQVMGAYRPWFQLAPPAHQQGWLRLEAQRNDQAAP